MRKPAVLALAAVAVVLMGATAYTTLPELTSRPALLSTDLFPVQPAGATRMMKTTLSAIQSGMIGTSRTINTTAPLAGGGTLATDLTLSLNNAGVTYAKIQNVTSARLLGRSTAGAGVVEELTVGSGLLLSGGTLSNSSAGTVSSVGITGPSSFISWSGTPVTTSGTLTGALASQSAGTWFGNNTGGSAAPTFVAQGSILHNSFGGLTTGDPHTQYPALLGRSGGQTLNGGTGSGDVLNLHGSTNATSGGVTVSNGDNLTIASPYSGGRILGQSSELKTLSGAVTNTTANLLPANSIIRAVTLKVTTGLSGSCSAFHVGDSVTAQRFASSVSGSAGTLVVGLTHVDQTGAAGPKQTSAAQVYLTCTSGTASGGVVRITVYYDQFVAPQF